MSSEQHRTVTEMKRERSDARFDAKKNVFQKQSGP